MRDYTTAKQDVGLMGYESHVFHIFGIWFVHLLHILVKYQFSFADSETFDVGSGFASAPATDKWAGEDEDDTKVKGAVWPSLYIRHVTLGREKKLKWTWSIIILISRGTHG